MNTPSPMVGQTFLSASCVRTGDIPVPPSTPNYRAPIEIRPALAAILFAISIASTSLADNPLAPDKPLATALEDLQSRDDSVFTPALRGLIAQGRPAVPHLVELLKFPDPNTRSRAAHALRSILELDPAARHNDHGRAFWLDKTRATLPGMKKADVLTLLPPDPPVKDFSQLPGHGTGDSHSIFYRLDDYWEVTLTFRNTDALVSTPALRESTRPVYVAAPKDFTGPWTTYFVNGQKSHDIHYKNGKYNGPFTTYHDDGAPSVQQHYTDHHANGPDTGRYKSGQKMYEGQYENDQQIGLWTHWYESGKVQQTVTYKNGQRHGQYTSYYPTGQKHHEVMYKDGQQHGPDTYWDEQGKTLWSRRYEMGKLIE